MNTNGEQKKDLFVFKRFVIKLDTIANDFNYNTITTHWFIKDMLFGKKWRYNSLQQLFNDREFFLDINNVPANQSQFFYLDIAVHSVEDVKNIFISFL